MSRNKKRRTRMKKLVLAYERVSSDEQKKKGFSISEQQDDITEYARLRGDVIDQHYIDHHSGTTMHRRGVKQLLKKVSEGNVERIYIKYANRLSRDDTMVRSLRKVFFKFQVEIVSINDDWAAEDANADKKLSCDLVSRVDGTEPERAQIRTRAGLMMSAKLGNWPKSNVPMGFVKVTNPKSPNKGYAIVPDEKWREPINKIVQLIEDKQLTGESIANFLNSTNELGRKWTAKEVLAIASKPEYHGAFNQSYYQSENHHEGFYSKEDHDLMYKILHGRRREKKYIYLFKGLLFCEECGSLLTCIPTLKKSKGKNNRMLTRPIFYYYCKECNKRINEAKLLPDVMFDFENNLIEDPAIIEERKKCFRKTLRIRSEIERLEDDYFEQLINDEYFFSKRTELLKKLKEAEKKMHDIESDITEWSLMTRYDQRKRIQHSFKKIVLDLTTKTIKAIDMRTALAG